MAGLIVLALATLAGAQARLQFPSQLDGAPNVGTTPAPTLRTAPNVLPPNAGAQPLAPNFDPYAQPGLQNPYANPAPYGQPYTPPATTYGTNPYAQPYGANPYVQPQPYGANPYAAQPGYAQPYPGQPAQPYPDGLVIPRPRRLQQLAFDYAFIPGGGGSDLQINDFNVRGTFAFFPMAQMPLLVTPGFGLHLWHGPDGIDLPNQVYDFTLDFNIKPRLGEHVSFDLGVTPGIFTDFDGLDSDAFRVQGRAVAIITPNNRAQFIAGIVYYDRLDVKLLPVLGMVWTPNQDTRFELVFPRPKLSQRLTSVGNTEWWWYVAGEYGGGTWSADVGGVRQKTDYGDIRLLLGLDWANYQGARGMVEVGYAVDRELQFETIPADKLDSSLLFRAGIVY